VENTTKSPLRKKAARRDRRQSLKTLQERIDFLEELCIALGQHVINADDGAAYAKILSHTAALAQPSLSGVR